MSGAKTTNLPEATGDTKGTSVPALTMAEKAALPRRWGDRRDGRLVKMPALQGIMAYIIPKRADCEVYLHETIDVTDLEAFLEKRNAEHPDVHSTVFHAFLMAIARMIYERPMLNRFVQGYRIYERDEISLSFVAKRRFADGADEALMVFVPDEQSTLESLSRKINGDVKEARKSEHANGGIDSVIEGFMKIPRPILAVVLRFVRILDFWGKNPKVLTDGDPNYTTVLASNLGSIGGPAIYHHLNNYGTNSIMVTLGTMHKEPVRMADGTFQERTLVDFGAILDERIGDGFYFIRSLKLIRYIFAHPELLDVPLAVPSGFTYE